MCVAANISTSFMELLIGYCSEQTEFDCRSDYETSSILPRNESVFRFIDMGMVHWDGVGRKKLKFSAPPMLSINNKGDFDRASHKTTKQQLRNSEDQVIKPLSMGMTEGRLCVYL